MGMTDREWWGEQAQSARDNAVLDALDRSRYYPHSEWLMVIGILLACFGLSAGVFWVLWMLRPLA